MLFPPPRENLDITPDERLAIHKLVLDVLNAACKTKAAPRTLFHYTTPSGFLGIVQSGVLRGTHLAFTNDAVEHLQSSKTLTKCVSQMLKTTQSIQEKKLLEAIETGLNYTTPFNTLPITVSCFCESGNLLSQWRGYGQGEGGIAIGLDTGKLYEASARTQSILVPVIYDPLTQERLANQLLAAVVSAFNSMQRTRPAADVARWTEDFLHVLSTSAAQLAPLFKDDGFAEEAEWRLVRHIRSTGEIKYLAKATHLSPYVEVPIGTPRPNAKLPNGNQMPDLLPITEVWFGPGRFQEHAYHSCGHVFTSLQYAQVALHNSRTPFRAMI